MHDRTRFLLTTLTVSVAMLLVVGMTGLYFGFIAESSLYIERSGTDVWVYSQGSPNFYYTISFLPLSLQPRIASTPGVQAVSPIIYQGGTMKKGSSSAFVFYIGYDTATGIGGPWDVFEGSARPGPGQVVIDNFLAAKLGAGVGDTVTINKDNFTIAGISQGPTGFLAYYVFVPIDDAAKLANLAGYVNAYQVRVTNDSSIPGVVSSLSLLPGVQASSTADWAKASSDAILANLLPTVEGLLTIGLFVGTLVVGLTNYTATVQRQREYGTLKALGFSNAGLYRVVLIESLATTLVSLAIGSLLAYFGILGLRDVFQAPYLFVYDPYSLSYLVLGALAVGAIGSVLPARRIAKIEPAVAFK